MTLTEIIIVITIIGSLTAAIGYGLFSRAENGRFQLARTQGQNLRSSARTWKMQNTESDECPTFEALRKASLADKVDPADPWGKKWKIVCTESDIAVISPGKDTKEGTEDDIRVPEK
jgi:general secretion pathway protein G